MSPRFSTQRGTTIEYSYWLVFDDAGGMRMSRGEPDTSRREVKMKCSATLPRSLFSKPTLSAKVTVAEGEPQAFNIDVQAASVALSGALGVDIDLKVEHSK